MTPEDVLRTAGLLADKIRARRTFVTQATQYYRGEEGRMRFASDEFRQYFAQRFSGFSDNWCMPVADAPIERIGYIGQRLADEQRADTELERIWERNDAHRGLSEAILMMTIAKRSYGLVSPQGGGRITFENPDSAAVLYDVITGRRKAGMLVRQDDTHEYGQLMIDDGAARWLVPVKREKVVVVAGEKYVPPTLDGWDFHGDAQRLPFDALPLVEMRNKSLLDNDPISDIAMTMPMQDAINLVWAYTLNNLDYISLPGRVIMNGEAPTEDILDENGNKIGERPVELDALIRDRIAWLEGQDIKIGEWSAGSVDGFTKVIELAVAHVAAQTRTPAHYLLSASDNVPATGYDLAEAGLVSKANERIAFAQPAVREMNRLLAIAAGDTVRAERIAAGRMLWRKPQFRSEAQLVDGLSKLKTLGFPFEWLAEEYGLEPDEVRRVVEMAKAERADPTMEQVARELRIPPAV